MKVKHLSLLRHKERERYFPDEEKKHQMRRFWKKSIGWNPNENTHAFKKIDVFYNLCGIIRKSFTVSIIQGNMSPFYRWVPAKINQANLMIITLSNPPPPRKDWVWGNAKSVQVGEKKESNYCQGRNNRPLVAALGRGARRRGDSSESRIAKETERHQTDPYHFYNGESVAPAHGRQTRF